jgi:hypothetical protein
MGRCCQRSITGRVLAAYRGGDSISHRVAGHGAGGSVSKASALWMAIAGIGTHVSAYEAP